MKSDHLTKQYPGMVKRYSHLATICLFLLHSLCHSQNLGDSHSDPTLKLSQKYLVQQLTIENGLSDNIINALLQDRKGFIWIGTNNGLNRYDGYQFKIYKHQPGETSSISHNIINALLEDEEGKIWIATQEGLNCFDPLTDSFVSFRHDPNNSRSLANNNTRAVYEDSQGILWVGTLDGLNRFDKEDQTFHLFQHSVPCTMWDCAHINWVNSIGETKGGKLIVGYWGMGVMLFDKKTNQFQKLTAHDVENYEFYDWIRGVAGSKSEHIVVATDQNLFKLGESGELTSVFINGRQVNAGSVAQTRSGFLLVGTHREGLYILNNHGQVVHHFLPEVQDIVSIRHNMVAAVIEDLAGDIWLGTLGLGIFRLSPGGNRFLNFKNHPEVANSLSHNHVQSLLEVKEDLLWVGTSNHGIHIFDRTAESFRPLKLHLQNPTFNPMDGVLALMQDSEQNIWIGTYGKGLIRYQQEEGAYQQFIGDFQDSTKLPDHYVYDILETAEGEIWIGTPKGIAVLPDQEAIRAEQFKQYRHAPDDKNSLANNTVNCLAQTRSGQIWIGTNGGLQVFNREKEAFRLYQHNPEEINTLSDNAVLSIFENSKEELWIGTRGGLNKFDPNSGDFIHFTEKDGLSDGRITQIQEDEQGFLWLGTTKGISRFNPANGQFKNYDAKDGLNNYNIEAKTLLLSKYSGGMYAGGKNGITFFYPDSIQDNPFIPPIAITSLKKYNIKNQETSEETISGIEQLEKMVLTSDDNIITLELAALNYRRPEKNQYAYKLDGFNDGWIHIGNKREITFTNLDPGNYTLHVKGSNNDGVWNEEGTMLRITVLPPWWKTTWAYVTYSLLVLLLLFGIYYVLLRRQQLRHQLVLEKEEADRLKELDSFKTRLFTNLTHEFRTPLTVILGMARQIQENPKNYFRQGLDLIERNGTSLLQLINQMLDLSKLENNAFQLNQKQADLVPFVRYVTESFQSYANNKNLALRFLTSIDQLVVFFDPTQVQQILTNLISNALKFTQSGGEITVRLENHPDQVQLSIKDTGIGINPDKLPYIFDRFYQVDDSSTRPGEGTGIGLAHSKELVKLMKGTIQVESQLGQGTTFKVLLPFKTGNLDNVTDLVELEDSISNGANFVSGFTDESKELILQLNQDLPHLLIAEDNPDVVTYLKACLEGIYRIEVAYNGRVGVELALEHVPDIIISDVMMPEKDGYELCNILKKDERTSHIPIILLTAKADDDSRLTGLRTGADAYLAKPFNKEELLVRLEKLLEVRQQLHARYSQLEIPGAEPESVAIIEDAFLKKLRQVVVDNLGNNQFSVDQLARDMAMSRMQLHRKLKALTNRSASNFIRTLRLQKAKELLQNPELTISEVAYDIGFNDPKYFSRVFAEEFGQSPTDFRGNP